MLTMCVACVAWVTMRMAEEEERRRGGGRRRMRSGTAPKVRTPHKDVGQK